MVSEKKQAFGHKSKESLSRLTYGKTCDIDVTDTDRYDRKVAQVVCNGLGVNLEQVGTGVACVNVEYARDKQYFAA